MIEKTPSPRVSEPHADEVSGNALDGASTAGLPARAGLETFSSAILTIFCLTWVLSPTNLSAQAGAGFSRPGSDRPELPAFETPQTHPTDILPRLDIPREAGPEGVPPGVTIRVDRYRVVDSTVFTADELDALTSDFVGESVTYADIEAARDRITLAYIERGFITSGATIDDQEIENGVVEFRVVEGRLNRIDVTTDGRLQDDYVRLRAALATSEPINVARIEERLQLLQQDERIQYLDARLLPAERRGESVLNLDVTEARPLAFRFDFGNLESPAVGGWRGAAGFTHLNLTGIGDRLDLDVRHASGLDAINGSLSIPLNRYDTTLILHGDHGKSRVVEPPLDQLEIEGRFDTFGATLRQPVFRTRQTAVDLTVTAELRRSETSLFGIPFSFTEGQRSGTARLFVVRLGQEFRFGDMQQAFAARSTFNIGLDAFRATKNSGKVADGQFFSWLGQVQWARKLELLDSELLIRGDVQLTADPLLSLEQFAIGGIDTVRGYRTNVVVSDNAVVGALEFRVPVYRSDATATRIDIAPFVDVGRGWDDRGGGASDKALVSVGVGLRAEVGRSTSIEISWGHALRNRPGGFADDLQDSGVHFRFMTSL